MTRLAGSKIVAVDFQLPDVVTAYGDGTNTITATTYTDLPTTSCVASITNPHASASMITLVYYGAWMHASASYVRACPRVSGSTTIAAGINANGPVGEGELLLTGISANPQHQQAGAIYSLPASGTAATFTMQASRDAASGTQYCNYPTLRLIPLYYDL